MKKKKRENLGIEIFKLFVKKISVVRGLGGGATVLLKVDNNSNIDLGKVNPYPIVLEIYFFYGLFIFFFEFFLVF